MTSTIDIFPWDDNFNTGLNTVDEQHKQLVQLLNKLAGQLTYSTEELSLDEIFSELLDYTVYHFKTEETIWKRHLSGDSNQIQHCEKHHQFIETLNKLIAEQKVKPIHEVADHTLDFLVRWLASHILESDRYLAYIVLGIQNELPLEKAKEHATEKMSGFTRKMIDIILSIYGTLSSNTLRLMRELSTQRELEIGLKHQQALFKSLIKTLPDLIWLKDPEGVYLACNSRFEKFFGATESEITGKTDYDFIDRELADFFRAHDLKAIENDSPTINEEWITFASDGHKELLETTKTPMFDSEDQLIGVLGIGHNITERRAAEQHIQNINERLEEAQGLGHIGHWELDLLTNELYWSKEIYNIFGVNPETFGATYEAFLSFIHPDDRQIVDRSYTEATRAGKPYDVKHRIIRKSDSEVRYVHERSREVRDPEGKTIRSIGTVQDITDMVIAENEKLEQQSQLQKALRQTVQAVAYTVETRDPYTAGHQRRVADLAAAIAKEMKLSDDCIEGLQLGGMIHDLGKISIPAEILTRPGRLTEYEFEIIKTHSKSGYDIIKDIEFPWPVADIVHQHHERMDGTGYPQGLSGEEIILEARILAVADVVEAISSHRPYRPGLGLDIALKEIEKNRGTLYDEVVADSCLNLFASGYEMPVE